MAVAWYVVPYRQVLYSAASHKTTILKLVATQTWNLTDIPDVITQKVDDF